MTRARTQGSKGLSEPKEGLLPSSLRLFHRAAREVKVVVGDEQGHGTEQVLTTQIFILIFAMGTGANTITHPMGWDAVPSVMAQEACPVGQCHTGLSLCRGKRGLRVKVVL